jgi:chlorite dismutase
MLVHFRDSLDALGEAQAALVREPLFDHLKPTYSFLSVTEAGFYHITAEASKETESSGGKHGDAAYAERITPRLEKEIASPHIQRRLYPPIPPEMPYVCFYPMSKRRGAEGGGTRAR